MKRSYNPIIHLEGYIVAIFNTFRDKGMSFNSSNKRMIETVYDALSNLHKKSDKCNQGMLHHLNAMDKFILTYGVELTSRAEAEKNKGNAPTPEVIKALSDLQQLRKQMEQTKKSIEGLGEQYNGSKKD